MYRLSLILENNTSENWLDYTQYRLNTNKEQLSYITGNFSKIKLFSLKTN